MTEKAPLPDAKPWYRGEVADYWRPIIAGPLLGVVVQFILWLDLPYRDDLSLQILTTAPYGELITSGLLIGVTFIPVLVLARRWVWAGQPLPNQLVKRPWKRVLVATSGLQVVLIALALLTLAIGAKQVAQTITALPTPLPYLFLVALPICFVIALFGPPIAMYLDARYLDEDGLLSLFGESYVLPILPLWGSQALGIPTLVALYYYLPRRKRAAREIEVSIHG